MNIDFSFSELLVCVLMILSGALGYIIKRQHDKIQSIKNQISDKKYNVYNEVFSIFFDLMRKDKGYKIGKDKDNLPDRVIQVKKDLLIYGTDEIIRQYSEWLNACNDDNQSDNLKYYIALFTLIRKDMGYNRTKINRLNVLELIMGNKEEAKKFERDYFGKSN
ncbi:hypothetical protein LJC52_02650 [Bacteroidales bacterium OttesenSCG-928-A17]|nr:hypothetical protein [Bacteroidales bacterium OttesenSCG-928-A17]